MKIKVEFEINIDLKEAKKKYGDEGIKYFLKVTEDEHLQKITKILKDGFEDEDTEVKVNSLSVSKGRLI